ncbi:MAG TPA: MFS transporter [Cyclobacteriaceae bacterium]
MSNPNPYAALKLREFRLFVTARVCITMAMQIQAVVVGWQMYELTKDPLSLGLIGLAEAIPSIGVSLYAGHVADIVHRKKIIIITLIALAFCSFSLLTFTTDPGAFVFQWGPVPLYVIIFISGIARGFISPAWFSFMPQLVPRDLYQNAITWNSTLWEAASITGPALGGLVYGFFGITAAYAVDASLVVLGLSSALAISNKPLPPLSEEQGVAEKIKAGLRFVFQNKLILGAISLDLFAVLFGGAVALLPIFADKILHTGAIGLGFLRCAPSIGAVITAFYITHNPIKRNMGKTMFWSVAGFGMCMICFAISENFWLSISILALSGVFDCISVIIRGTLMQTLTPENMKGRVSAVNYIFIGSSNEIGMFESGVAARILGVVPSVIFGGCMTIGVVATTAWLAKSLRKLQSLE